MKDISIDNLLNKAKNKFLLVNAAAGRAKQVAEGSLPYIDDFDPSSPVITALREIASDKIRIKILSDQEKKAKPQDLLVSEESFTPSAMERLARGSKPAAPKKKEKKKK